MSQLQRLRSRPVVVAGACGMVVVAATLADVARAASAPVTTGRSAVTGAHGTVRDGDGSYRLTLSLSGAPSRKR